MSRLDSFIRRLTAQREILNCITDDLADIEGPVLELGLGNGRTYDHLLERLPDRRIIAFDRADRAFTPSMPDGGDLVIGEIEHTGKDFLGINAALAHADIGTGYPEQDALTLAWLPDLMAGVLATGGIAASGLPLDHPALEPMDLPPGVNEGRYFIYRRR